VRVGFPEQLAGEGPAARVQVPLAGDAGARAREGGQVPRGLGLDRLARLRQEREAVPQRAAEVLHAGVKVEIAGHQPAEAALALDGEMMFDLVLVWVN